MPGFSMLALFGIIEPIRLANQLLGRCHYEWRVFSSDGTPPRASCGLTIATTPRPGPESAPQCVIVIAGFDPWPQNDRRLKSWLRALDRRGVILGAVDTGAFLLASAGLLDGVATALHWESAAAFSELFPEIPISDRLFEVHPRRWLCAGGSAALDMSLDLLEREHGAGLCAGLDSRLMHTRRRQKPPPLERVPAQAGQNDLAETLRIMEAHIEEPLSIAALAAMVPISQRSLERKCRLALGRTPTQIYLDVRLERARRILRHSDIAIREVALSCGFTSIPYFCRAYKARYRVPPGSDRTLDEVLAGPASRSTNSDNIAADLGNSG
jgi:AraC family carnitine catabolism transcriptional activator